MDILLARGKKLYQTETACHIYSFQTFEYCVSLIVMIIVFIFILHFSATRQKIDKNKFKLLTSDCSAKKLGNNNLRKDLYEYNKKAKAIFSK